MKTLRAIACGEALGSLAMVYVVGSVLISLLAVFFSVAVSKI